MRTGGYIGNGSEPQREATSVLVSTTLATDGSYTAATSYPIRAGVAAVTIAAPYTRGTSGGRALLKLRWAVGSSSYYDTSPAASSVVGATVETPVGVTVIPGPIPASSAALGYLLTVLVPDGATALVVEVAEADSTKATPGTIGPVYLASGTV